MPVSKLIIDRDALISRLHDGSNWASFHDQKRIISEFYSEVLSEVMEHVNYEMSLDIDYAITEETKRIVNDLL